VALSLDNGLGLTPQMGYSSWNDVGSVVTEAHIKATASYFVSSGLADKGYTYINVDEGWFVGREKTAPFAMVEDKTAFPSTMKGLGTFIHGLTVRPLPVCRGSFANLGPLQLHSASSPALSN
jgi:alpha-galactosidase